MKLSKMIKKIYLLYRRRFSWKITSVTITAIFILYMCNFFIQTQSNKSQIIKIVEIHKCPACYGLSACGDLYSDLITLRPSLLSFINAKNIYRGITDTNKEIVLKKLAQNSELREFDDYICNKLNMSELCKSKDIMQIRNYEIDNEIVQLANMSKIYGDNGIKLVFCPNPEKVKVFIKNLLRKGKHWIGYINAWTILKINPEPLILITLQKSKGWRVPAYGGVCGRVELVSYEGEPLSSLSNVPWLRKVMYAKQILQAAMDFTFKHERYRFYLMDWSLDNIVVNKQNQITFVDLEDIVVVDSLEKATNNTPDWNSQYQRENLGPGFSFSIESICSHHLSDHNIWAACFLLAGDDPYLLPIPQHMSLGYPKLYEYLDECVHKKTNITRLVTALKIVNVMKQMFTESNFFH